LPFNPIEQEWKEEVIPRAIQAEIGVIGMKPLAGGALTHANAALRWALTRGVDVVIPGMDTVEQVRANAAAAESILPPTGEELKLLEQERALWGDQFCRRCAYCMPCPNGLNIPFLLLIEAYYTRYRLTDWALARLEGLEHRYQDCVGCGECTQKCPYDLPVPQMMERALSVVV
jgi:predicted aldo/keto reductase-like oxidoreductase